MYNTITLTREDAVAVLTLNLPEKRNPMTTEMAEEFHAAITAVSHMEEVGALVLAANGKAFSGGGDYTMLENGVARTPEQNRRVVGGFYHHFLSILHLDIPTIAAIQGAAIGAGLSLTLTCDMRIAAENAKMGAVFVNLGLHPGMATTHLLPAVMGATRATDLILTGRLVTGQEAFEMGLVNRVTAREEVLPEALKIAHDLAAKPKSAVRMAKRALNRAKLNGLEAALDYELSAQMTSFASPELKEALATLQKK